MLATSAPPRLAPRPELLGIGDGPMPLPAGEFALYLCSETGRWTGVVQAARIVID